MLETFDVADRPGRCVEDAPFTLCDLDPLRRRGTAALARLDADVDGAELGDAQVVARERRGPRVLASRHPAARNAHAAT